ncbi:hypothetical protein JFT44_11490 [Pseudomonas sp. MF5691]|nr:hypothetical protein [Pseudomonas sp. MF5691]
MNSHLYSRWLDGESAHDEPAHCFGSPLPGGLAEYMIIHEDSAVGAPHNMTDVQASTLPIAALTAWYSLVDYGQLKPGQTVLVQGTGGVPFSRSSSPRRWARRSSLPPAAMRI